MLQTIETTLDLMQAEKKKVGGNVRLPAENAAITDLQDFVRKRYYTEINPAYVELLRKINGVDFSGTVLYAAAENDPFATRRKLEFANLNEIFYDEGNDDYVLYGETGDELFAQQISTNTWQILDRGSLSLLESFVSCDLLIERVLTRAYDT